MEKSWMNLSRVSSAYENGLERFLDFAFQNSSLEGMILCPCKRCGNAILRTKDVAREHLIVDGFIKGYTYWIAHGELKFTHRSSSNFSNISYCDVRSHLKSKCFDAKEPIESAKDGDEDMVIKDQQVQLMVDGKSDSAKVLSNKNNEVKRQKKMHHWTGEKSFGHIANESVKGEESNGGVHTAGDGVAPSGLCTDMPTRKSSYWMEMEQKAFEEIQMKHKEIDEQIKAHAAQITELQAFVKQHMGNSKQRNSPIHSSPTACPRGASTRPSRVHMVGDGSYLCVDIPTRYSSYRTAMERKSAFEKMQMKYNELAEQVKAQGVQIAELQAIMKQQMDNGLQHNSPIHSSSTDSVYGPSTRPLRVEAYVAIRSLFDESKSVAKGRLQSLNPSTVVGRHKVGEHWCEVLVQEAVEPSEALIRPYDKFVKISDVLGCSVAWPVHLVIPRDE